MAELAGVGNSAGGGVLVGGDVLSEGSDDLTRHQADEGAAPGAVRILAVEQDDGGHQGADGGQHHSNGNSAADDAQQGGQGGSVGVQLLATHVGDANQGQCNAGAGNPEGVRHLRVISGQGTGSDDGRHERLEQIGAHTGDITHVVTDVVGNHGRVARVILGDAGLNLTNQIGTDIGGLGEDTSTHTGKESHGGSAESETAQVLELNAVVAVGRAALEDQVHERNTNDTQTNNGVGHNGTRSKRNLQTLSHGVNASKRGAGVGSSGNQHAEVAGGSRQSCTDQQVDGSVQTGKLVAVLDEDKAEGNAQNESKKADVEVLSVQK